MADRPQRPAEVPPGRPSPLYGPPCKHERVGEIVWAIVVAVVLLSWFFAMGYHAARAAC